MAIAPAVWHTQVFFDDTRLGNQATVVLLDKELDKTTMQSLAAESSLPASVFIWPESDKQYSIHWFSPTQAIQLCGHATLAASFILKEIKDLNHVEFITENNQIISTDTHDDQVSINLPLIKLEHVAIENDFNTALNTTASKQYQTTNATGYVVLELDNINTIETITPDFKQLGKLTQRAIIITALNTTNKQIGFRYFAPQYGNNEDQATGSALCMLADFYNKEYNLSSLDAIQLSKQGGKMQSELKDEKVTITGRVKLC